MLRRKLGRKSDHRKSLMRNLAASLVLYEKVDTTLPKAKELRSEVEKLIALSKNQNLNTLRYLLGYFYDKNAAKKVYNELSARYKDRGSGFIRLYHLNNRLGDNAQLARIELVDRKVFIAAKKVAEKSKKEDRVREPKLSRTQIKAQKRLDKLLVSSQKGGVVTSVRTKAARKTGV